ncbi:MAG: FtsK/SpoIIIE domain-containing protein [Bacteriovoracia bacterium]
MNETKKTNTPSSTDKMIGEILNEAFIQLGPIFVFFTHSFWFGLKQLRSFKVLLMGISLVSLITMTIIHYQWHLQLLHDLSSWLFPLKRLQAIHDLGFQKNFSLVAVPISTVLLWIIGIIPYFRFKDYQHALDSIGLKNAKDVTAEIDSITRLDEHRTRLIVYVSGIGAEKLKAKQDELQSAFGKDIEEINRLKNPKYVEIILSTKFLPEYVTFEQLQGSLDQSESFLIGESKKETVIGKISKLPHMLIAGATGGGKSQFFKQMLLGLLKSTNHLQMYLVDLKGGLEFREFSQLSNVRVSKSIEDALITLKLVKKEMDNRFTYLEKKGLEQINPDKHPFDRIVIGIDEASVLYGQARKDSVDYELVSEARDLTESIAKLGRAAAIHLILATQKVSKETIDTRMQENISGRMCFKLNTPEGSVRVLGNAKASHLPATPGRGIWQFGHDEIEVQTPFLSSNSMKPELQLIAQDYAEEKKTLNQPMGFATPSESSSVPVKKPSLTKQDVLNA